MHAEYTTVLRQVALKSFKNEISTLRTQVHQVSMERDKLKTSLNRTVEEKSKLITEGDEHVEMVTKRSDKEKRCLAWWEGQYRAIHNPL